MSILFFVLGMCIGSFSNVLIYRLPKSQSINFPASHCMSCNTPLKFYHNIPIISWIFLRGKCAFCKEKISIQYPIVELLSAILMTISYLYEISIIKACILGVCFILLLALSIIDLKYKAVPDSLLYSCLIVSLFYGFYDEQYTKTLLNASIFAFIFWFLRFIVSKFMKKEAMGSADIYIAAIIGAILGLKFGFIAIYIAAITTLPAYIVVRKKEYELPFVPFLSLGLLIVYMFKTQFQELINFIYG